MILKKRSVYISRPPALCVAPGLSPPHTTLAPNLYLATLVPNLYLPALAPKLYLPALAPNLYLPALAYSFITSPGPELHIPTLSPQYVFAFTALCLRFLLPVWAVNLHLHYYW